MTRFASCNRRVQPEREYNTGFRRLIRVKPGLTGSVDTSGLDSGADHARDVDEAVKIFEQYNIDFGGGPPIHYLIADPSGKAVLIEFYQGEMILLPNEAAWHMATNHLRCIAEGDGGCPRYRTISAQLTAANGQLDPQAAMQLLSEVKQGMTQWSTVYDMTSGYINVVISGFYDAIYSFHLERLNP